MQALSSSSSLTYTDDQHSPNRGGVTDMDTSNDEKLELEPNGMECNTLDKNETQQVSLSSEQQQQQQLHQHQQQQQQRNLHHLLHQPPPPSTRGPNTPVATVATHHHTNLLPTNTDGLCQKASAGSTATASKSLHVHTYKYICIYLNE